MTEIRWVASAVREVVKVDSFRNHPIVAHYSIPAFDAVGGPAMEPTEDIASDKLAVDPGDVLVSKLNPRKSRVQIVGTHDVPSIASTEFVVLRPHGIDTRYLAY